LMANFFKLGQEFCGTGEGGELTHPASAAGQSSSARVGYDYERRIIQDAFKGTGEEWCVFVREKRALTNLCFCSMISPSSCVCAASGTKFADEHAHRQTGETWHAAMLPTARIGFFALCRLSRSAPTGLRAGRNVASRQVDRSGRRGLTATLRRAGRTRNGPWISMQERESPAKDQPPCKRRLGKASSVPPAPCAFCHNKSPYLRMSVSVRLLDSLLLAAVHIEYRATG